MHALRANFSASGQKTIAPFKLPHDLTALKGRLLAATKDIDSLAPLPHERYDSGAGTVKMKPLPAEESNSADAAAQSEANMQSYIMADEQEWQGLMMGSNAVASMNPENMDEKQQMKNAVILVAHVDEENVYGYVVNKIQPFVDMVRFTQDMKLYAIDWEHDLADEPIHYGGPKKKDYGVVIAPASWEPKAMAGRRIQAGDVKIYRDDLALGRIEDPKPLRPPSFMVVTGHLCWGHEEFRKTVEEKNAFALCGEASIDLVLRTPNTDKWREALLQAGHTEIYVDSSPAKPVKPAPPGAVSSGSLLFQ
jgi:putative AlgH/UPF0301 family transcriptional regulator